MADCVMVTLTASGRCDSIVDCGSCSPSDIDAARCLHRELLEQEDQQDGHHVHHRRDVQVRLLMLGGLFFDLRAEALELPLRFAIGDVVVVGLGAAIS